MWSGLIRKDYEAGVLMGHGGNTFNIKDTADIKDIQYGVQSHYIENSFTIILICTSTLNQSDVNQSVFDIRYKIQNNLYIEVL